jgi:CRP/FNR family transcriptional regulator, cyclic AMP receptor protein
VKNALARMPLVMGSLPKELAERLWADATLINAKSGKTLVSLGATSSNVYIVLQGRVQVTLFSLAGREVILRNLGEGAIFGELAAIDGLPRSASIVALSDCQLASVAAETFRSAISELPAGAMWLALRLTAQIRDLTERVFELNALRVRSRLHCELLRMCGAVTGDESRIMIDPAPTHAELASRVGTHREAVTREIGFLVEQGILEQQRRRMTVVDIRALAQLVRMATGEQILPGD